jgi:hypothetical protein
MQIEEPKIRVIRLRISPVEQVEIFRQAKEVATAQYDILMLLCDDSLSKEDRIVELSNQIFRKEIRGRIKDAEFSPRHLVFSSIDTDGNMCYIQNYQETASTL